MEATALIELASDKGYRSNGEKLQKDLSSHSKKSSSGCDEVTPTCPDDEWNSLTREPRAEVGEIGNIDTTRLLESPFSENQDANIQSAQSSKFEDSINCAFLNETYCIYYSESAPKNENITNLNPELDSGMEEREEVFFDVLKPQGTRTVALGRTCEISGADCEETAGETQKCGVDEDSLLGYYSAEEQEQMSSHPSPIRAGTLSVSNLGAELRSLSYEVESASNPEDEHITLESSSVISADSLNDFAQEYIPCVSKFQNCDLLKEYYEPKHEKCKERETSLMFPTVFVQRSNSLGNEESQSKNDFLNPQTLKTKMYTEKVKSQVSENKDFCGNAAVENRISQHLESRSTLPQDKALETLQEFSEVCQTSWSSIFDDSVISAHGCSHYKSLQSMPDPALSSPAVPPRIAMRGVRAVTEDSSQRAINVRSVNRACSEDGEGTYSTSVIDAAGCTVAVHQTVDVSTDFRACFTTSRATNARPSVVSTSSNTEITMMSKKRPSKWQSEKQKSVACNTDWSYGQDCMDTPVAVTKGSGKSLGVDSSKPSGNFQNKDSLELKTYDNTDLKKNSERKFQISEEMEKNLPSKCYEKIMQRAIEAEMHLLNVHYQMCHHNCCDIYKFIMENKGLNRNLPSSSAKKKLGLALLSILGDLKVRYTNLKEKIHKGIPLEELPPLSVESKLLIIFSSLVSRLRKEESHDFSGADSELDNQTASDSEVSPSPKKMHSQMSSLFDRSHPKQNTSPNKDGLKSAEINVEFSQLKLDDKECSSSHEVSEDWFDAKESMTGVGSSGVPETQIDHDRRNLKITVETKNDEPLQRDKGFLVHVDGLCPSVSEADLRSYFQKYQVSDISICDSSTDYRYASLAFNKNSDAKMAVKEMNGMEINGKSVNVRLVKTHGECTSPLSSKKSLNNLEKNTNEEVIPPSTVSRLPRTRPRQMMSEQGSALSLLDQDSKKNCKQIDSSQLLPKIPVPLISPNTLNLRSFTKIIKRLAELHPDVSRDHIIDALQEVRMNHKGFLNGLSISTIVEMTSSVLKNSASH
ncbi:RNA-binding protein 44 isoform X2 [Fukomys damarensis]|uniref:RNA-binding protein 44 isoform X2 n=1 Tax=Fukomys damarensis TaxID=885580 RepID=UPI0005401AAA|nr:RNA-binding protein 44 isoform X2 [Fukomys damarensis]